MPKSPLSENIIGTWHLQSREDRTTDGRIIREVSLGSDPYGLLFYDRGGNFAAQFMKKDRSDSAQTPTNISTSGANNTKAIGGYDAYFGTYTVDDELGSVTQHLVAALSAENVGQTVTRQVTVDGDVLVVSLNTTLETGERVTRTLKWQRVG
ncbi:MAG: lipocalin-like domain-containing protein [Parvularculaceae bacterium]